jgi:predicted ribosomally synthesized peptide with SipW-like signal peptide
VKKIGLIGLALVLGLGGLGVGYAMWSQTVNISGPVTTGTVDLSFQTDDFEPPIVTDFYLDPDSGNWIANLPENPQGYDAYISEYLGKNIGRTTATYADPETDCVTDKPGNETLEIVVENAYPGYGPRVTYYLHNIGSIPIHVVSYNITGEKQWPNGDPIYDLLFEWDEGSNQNGAFYEDVDGSGTVNAGDPRVIDVYLSNSLPFQLEPCNSIKREIDLRFLQPLQQLKKYVFNVEIKAQQWAE